MLAAIRSGTSCDLLCATTLCARDQFLGGIKPTEAARFCFRVEEAPSRRLALALTLTSAQGSPETGSPRPVRSVSGGVGQDHLRRSGAGAPRSYRWRVCRCLRASPRLPQESTCGKRPDRRSAPGGVEVR